MDQSLARPMRQMQRLELCKTMVRESVGAGLTTAGAGAGVVRAFQPWQRRKHPGGRICKQKDEAMAIRACCKIRERGKADHGHIS